MGRLLDQTDDEWPIIRSNIKQTMTVWGRLGKPFSSERAYYRVEGMFYMAVTDALLLFCSKTWVLLSATKRELEGTQMDFLSHIIGKR